MTTEIAIQRLASGAGLDLPRRASADAAGFDLCAAVAADEMAMSASCSAVGTGTIAQSP